MKSANSNPKCSAVQLVLIMDQQLEKKQVIIITESHNAPLFLFRVEVDRLCISTDSDLFKWKIKQRCSGLQIADAIRQHFGFLKKRESHFHLPS